MQSRFESLVPNLAQVNHNDRLALLNPHWQWSEVKGDRGISLGQMLADELWLALQVDVFAASENPPTRKVAASLVQKKLMVKILSPLVALHVVTGRIPQADLSRLVLDTQTQQLGWRVAPFDSNTKDFQYWLSDVAMQFFRIFRHQFGISPRVFWGNCALAIASPWSQLARYQAEGTGLDGKAVAEDARRFFLGLNPMLQAGLDWLEINVEGLVISVPRRRSCCLKYTLPGSEIKLCGTCNRRSEDEQIRLILQRYQAIK